MSKKIKTDFNPVKEESDGKRARRVIWTTKSLQLAIKGIEEGRKLVANPFYENNTLLLKGDLVFERTEEEIEEWKRCKNDIIYFVENYCKIMTPEGIQKVVLRDYQVEYLRHLEKNRLSILLAARQIGKTVTSALFMLHYILFNFDKNALVLGNKRKTAIEILDKAKKIFIEIPYFLRPGVYKWNESEIVLDNGCRLMAEATTINSGISFTFHCVLADEFAHVAPNILDKFYNNLFPTITAGKARFMITSTQNGYNLFYRLYSAAVAGENDYAPMVVSWDRVPEWNPEKKCWEKRDEAWHQRQVANYGSEEAFNAQFGTNFDVSANTLISQKILTKKRQDLVEFINKDLYGVPYSESFYWHPDYEPMESLKNDYIIITCDLAEGAGGDYTIFMFNKLKDINTNNTECIGYFRSNNISRTDYALALQLLCVYFMDQDKYLISLEYNTYGELFLQNMYDNMDNHLEISQKFDSSNFVKYYNESGTRYINGIKLTSGNKTSHCLLFKEAYERGVAENNSSKFMIELDKFCDDGTNHYKASYGHDDMVMAQVQLEFVKKTLQYKLLRGEFDLNHNAPTNNNIYNPFEQQWSMDDYYRIINNSNYYNGY
jgi:hypothetical protein